MRKSIFNCRLLCLLFTVAWVFPTEGIKAQCNSTSCSTLITGNSTINITVNAGSTLCISSGITYSGIITLNGGVLCNQGLVTGIIFNSGTFNNYGTFDQTTAVNMNSTGDVFLNLFPNSIFTTAGAFNHAPGNASTNLNLTMYAGSRFVIGGSFSSNKGNVSSRIGLPDPNGGTSGGGTSGGGTTGGLPALFNVSGQFNITNSSMDLVLLNGSYVNINGAVSLNAKYNKTITNVGSFNVNNTFNVGGNGQNTGIVTINNYSSFNIVNHFNLSYNNGVAAVNNYGIFEVGKSLTISKDGNTIANNNVFNIVNDLNVEHGAVTNDGMMTVRDVEVKYGSLANSETMEVQRDFSGTNAGAVITNNGQMNVSRELNVNGTLNLGLKSTITTQDYVNNAQGNIVGPVNIPDTLFFPRITILGNSQNSGPMTGNIVVYDQSLQASQANIGYGFDVVQNPILIGPNILSVAIVTGPPIGIGFNCNLLVGQYVLFANANPSTIYSGSQTNLAAQLNTVSMNGWFCPCYIPFNPTPPLVYTWQPTNLNGQNVFASPPTSQVFTVTTSYKGCPFSYQVSVNVITPVYAVLKRNVDAGFYRVNVNNTLYFKYDEEYKGNSPLNYKIYLPNHTVLPCVTPPASSYGDNRYSINLPACAGPNNLYYVLEITNEKNELFYLKFKY
jgi:hypothetical protein